MDQYLCTILVCSLNKVVCLAEVFSYVVTWDIIHGNTQVRESISVDLTRVKPILVDVFGCHIQNPSDPSLLQHLHVSTVMKITQK